LLQLANCWISYLKYILSSSLNSGCSADIHDRTSDYKQAEQILKVLICVVLKRISQFNDIRHVDEVNTISWIRLF
jgi:hypothetical protein